jgi:hypothetical protein
VIYERGRVLGGGIIERGRSGSRTTLPVIAA